MELMKSMTGAKLMHIAYRGAGPAFTDVISGQVSMIWEPVPASLPYIKGGQIRPIAIAADTRSPELPDTPTFKEAGLPRYEANAWNGLLAPKGLPADVTQKPVSYTHLDVYKRQVPGWRIGKRHGASAHRSPRRGRHGRPAQGLSLIHISMWPARSTPPAPVPASAAARSW